MGIGFDWLAFIYLMTKSDLFLGFFVLICHDFCWTADFSFLSVSFRKQTQSSATASVKNNRGGAMTGISKSLKRK